MVERTGKEPEIHIGFLRILPSLFSDMTKTIKTPLLSGFPGCCLAAVLPGLLATSVLFRRKGGDFIEP